MFKFFRRHQTFVMIALAACAVALPFLGIGSTSLLPSFSDTIMKVNGHKITQGDFDQLYNALLRQRPGATAEQKKQLMKEAVDELVRKQVFMEESKKFGIQVSDQELQMQIASIPAFQKDKQFDPQTYAQVVYQTLGTTPNAFEKNHRIDLQARKLNILIASTVQIPDEAVAMEVQARLAKEKDKEAIKKLKEDPESVRAELKMREANIVFRDWLNQLNANLKTSIVSDAFRKQLMAQ